MDSSKIKHFSLEDCYNILEQIHECKEYTVKSYELKPVSNKSGYLGDHSFLNINYIEKCDGKTRTVQLFVKKVSSHASHFLFDTGAFLKECHLFLDIVPAFIEKGVNIIRDCLPKCYLVSDMNYLIFEDLGLKHYKILNPRESMTVECVKLGLDALAKFHCSGLIFEEKLKKLSGEPYTLVEKFPELFGEAFFGTTRISVKFLTAIKKGVVTEVELFCNDAEVHTELFKKLAWETIEQFGETVQPSTKYRNTICHGDTWANNMMYKFKNDKPVHCCLVDFQTYRYTPPALDFMCTIYLTTDRQFRQHHMTDMKKYYHQKLCEILDEYDLSINEILPYPEFIECCDYYKRFAIGQSINYFQVVMLSPENSNSLLAKPDHFEKVLFDDRSIIILEAYDKDEIYKKKMSESITDLKDLLIEKGLL